jgi:hypothetical protein
LQPATFNLQRESGEAVLNNVPLHVAEYDSPRCCLLRLMLSCGHQLPAAGAHKQLPLKMPARDPGLFLKQRREYQ